MYDEDMSVVLGGNPMNDADKVNAVLRTLRDGADGPEVSTGSAISSGVAMLLAEIPGYIDRRIAEALKDKETPNG